MQLEAGQSARERIGNAYVTFEGTTSPEFDITDGQLLRRLQAREHIAPGTRVRVSHYDDRGTWFEVAKVVAVELPRAVAV